MADYVNYYEHLNGFGGDRMEPTFQIIKAISSYFNNPAIVGFFIYAFISVSIRLRVVYLESPLIWGSLLVYISYILILHDMIQIRAAVSSAMLIPIILSRYNANGIKGYLKTIILILIATLFHYSALSFLLVFFIDTKKSRRWMYISLIVVSYVLSISGIRFGFLFGLLYPEKYLQSMNANDKVFNIFNLVQLGRVSICALFWYMVEKIKRMNPHGLFYLKMYTLGICICPLCADFMSATRFADLFFSTEVVLIPLGILALFKNTVIQKGIVFLYSLVLFYYNITNPLFWG